MITIKRVKSEHKTTLSITITDAQILAPPRTRTKNN